jgi:hypothetical protein
MPLLDVKFLVALQPDKCIKQCTLAQPKCMWSPASQKLMWQMPSLPAADGASSGKLHAELTNDGGVASVPQPLSLSFLSDDLESVISGILVTEAEQAAKGNAAEDAPLPLGRLIYRIKSGLFTVL